MSPEKRMKGHCVLTQSVVNEAMVQLAIVCCESSRPASAASRSNLLKWITNLFEQTSNRPLSDVG